MHLPQGGGPSSDPERGRSSAPGTGSDCQLGTVQGRLGAIEEKACGAGQARGIGRRGPWVPGVVPLFLQFATSPVCPNAQHSPSPFWGDTQDPDNAEREGEGEK